MKRRQKGIDWVNNIKFKEITLRHREIIDVLKYHSYALDIQNSVLKRLNELVQEKTQTN